MKLSLSIFGAAKILWAILLPEQQRAGITLLGMMLLGTILEMLGIGLVLPVMALIVQDDPAATSPMLGAWINWLGSPPKQLLVIVGMLVLLGAYGVRTLFLALLVWRQSRFVYWLQASLAQRLFNGYLGQPYKFHLKHNSSYLIRNVISQVGSLVSVVQQGLVLLTELLVLSAFSFCLLLMEPAGVLLIIFVLGGAVIGFNRLTRKRIHSWGESLQEHETKRVQYLQEGLGGSKDIKLMGREQEFIDKFEAHNAKSAKVLEMQATLLALPRLWLELLAVGGLVILVLVMVWQEKPMDTLIPVLGLFGAAAFRLMPSVNRIIGGVQNTRFSIPVIENLAKELRCFPKQISVNTSCVFPFSKELTLSNVSFRYDGMSSNALNCINIRIARGSVVGVIGSSGAGKSTLVDIILGLLQPTCGHVCVDGLEILTNVRGWQNKIGYVPQNIYLTDDTLRRNIAFGIADNQIDDASVMKAVTAAQLDGLIADLPSGLQTKVGERGVRFSGGQRQRVGIARALYHNPELLVLDEATSALDIETESAFMQAVSKFKGEKTIIVIAHRLTTVSQCDWIYRLNNGAVIQQGPARDVLNGLTSACDC